MLPPSRLLPLATAKSAVGACPASLAVDGGGLFLFQNRP